MKPVYVQVAEAIEDDILLGKLKDGDPAYSQLILSRELNINPATVAKGINLLVQKGILVKQRGLSMTVAPGAKEHLMSEKIETGFAETVTALVEQSIKIGLPKEQVLKRIHDAFADYERRDMLE